MPDPPSSDDGSPTHAFHYNDPSLPPADAQPTLAADSSRAVAPRMPDAFGPHAGDRYRISTVLGKGGMGEVLACDDQLLGRQVALKVILPASADRPVDRERFVREAAAQAQLEHPGILPVYDLGQRDDGELYFTMRRVRGETLHEVLKSQRAGTTPVSRHRLLTIFQQACRALEYAHESGVLHRDLKPANVMLGPFGEVYVLDWGLSARREEATEKGAASGSPGYMAPEQASGSAVDARADVYALGAILFEILTLRPLHEGVGLRELLASTLGGAEARASVRAPEADVPPELEASCVRATALDPAARYGSVRELREDVERYLDGDRDEQLRRAMSKAQADGARAAAVRARGEGSDAAKARREALRSVGRSLALDPGNADALRVLVQLLTEPPREMPPEAEEAMHATERGFQRLRARAGAAGFLSWIALTPCYIWFGIVNLPAFLFTSALWTAMGGVLAYESVRPSRDGYSPLWVAVGASIALGVASSTIGPLWLGTTFAMVFSIGFSLAMRPSQRYVPMVTGCLSVFVPWLLEQVHVLPPTLIVEGKTVRVVGYLFGQGSFALVLPTNLFCLAAACYFGVKMRERLTEMQRRVHLTMWQMSQLIPRTARKGSSAPTG